MHDMNSGESYIVTEDNWWRDGPQSKASRVSRWVFGVLGMIVLAAVLLFASFAVGMYTALAFATILGEAQVIDVVVVITALVIGAILFIVCVTLSIVAMLALLHPLNNWIHDRMDVLVID